MSDVEIDVRYEPDHEVPQMRDGRPMLTWDSYPIGNRWHNGWNLWYFDDNGDVDRRFLGGEFTDVEGAVRDARNHLVRVSVSDPFDD